MNLNFKNTMEKLKKTCYQPVVEKNNKLNYAGSKYYGNVWIADGEKWPTNELGIFHTFIYQLEIATLPIEIQTKLNKKGTLQFFYDISNHTEDEDYLVRIVEPNENGKYYSQPQNTNAEHNYLINDEKPQQLIIKEWKAHDDYPGWDENLDGLEELWQEVLDSDDFDDEKYSPILGDKLGGYGYFPQGSASSEDLIYQIQFDENEEYEENQFPSYAPNLIASDGTGHLFFNDDDDDENEFTFYWTCG